MQAGSNAYIAVTQVILALERLHVLHTNSKTLFVGQILL